MKKKLLRVERLLKGVADATNYLLTMADYSQGINEVLATLGQATEVDRIYIFHVHPHPENQRPACSQLWEWVAQGITPQINNPDLQNILFEDMVPRWYNTLKVGGVIEGNVGDFPEEEKNQLEFQGIISILIVPILIKDNFWGLVGFDDCHQEQNWKEIEISTLRAIAGSIGGIIARHEAEQQLQLLNQDLERRIQIRTQELILAKEEADKANQAKSEFLANMSHELRTPLNGILGYAQILNRSPFIPEKERNGIDIIYQCGNHLLTLINDILDLAKIEAQKFELNPTVVHLSSFLEGVVDMIKVRSDKKGIDFIYHYDPNLPDAIVTDEKRLRQILINLLTNAIKFTDEGNVTLNVKAEGIFPIKLEQCSICQQQLDCDRVKYSLQNSYYCQIKFEVGDTGIGIAEKELPQIFQVFEQVGKDKNRYTEGTGLGLAITQKIAHLMDSTIKVKSTLGKGSDFWFRLNCPISQSWKEELLFKDEAQIIGYEEDTVTILVVDDRWENRSVLVNLLEPLGFILKEAENGEEAFNILQNNSINVMITDIIMPVMNGYDLIKKVKNDSQFQTLKIIVSSASVSDRDQQISLEIGGDDFLPKPVDANKLLESLTKHLHLTWQYKEINTSLTPTATEMIIPPQEDLQSLLSITQDGLITKLVETVKTMSDRNSSYLPFVNKVLSLAKSFEIEEIESFIQEWLR
ncbi:ATP-binding protein [Geminocystis sp. CENA526]|uniref:ATP-binding protein n=1 Tax=Geminocystis sp. CENA526 TaxID=1355871 RepID=UPI003D6F338F